jgi:TonB family protein
MTQPEAIAQPTPRYPTTARVAGREGTVVLEAVIDEQGRVSKVQVLRGLGLGCDEAAVEAVERWRFRPATLQGRPIPVLYTLTVHFKIAR